MMSTAFLDAVRDAVTTTVEVLYTDLDGTLLGPGGSLLTGPDSRPSARAAQALVDAAAAGLVIVPVSGRQRRQLQQDARLLGLHNCIAEAGAVIVRDDEVRYEWGECPRDLAANPHDALVAAGALTVLLDSYPHDLRLFEPWHRDREGGLLLHGLVHVEDANRRLAAGGIGWAQLIDNGATGGWPGRQVRAYHLLPWGVGKALAVADDLRARGLTPAQAAAIGDSLEDATMASAVGLYFQVANGHAHPEHPAIVTPGAMGHGVADAVAALLAVRSTAAA